MHTTTTEKDTMTTVPEFMPVISSGKHESPKEGACVMEYVSILSGEEFTDRPRCTDPKLASLAISINDILPDHHRSVLIPFITQLIGTDGPIPEGHRYARWCECMIKAETRIEGVSDAIATLNDTLSRVDPKNSPERFDYTTALREYFITSYANWMIEILRGAIDSYWNWSGLTRPALHKLTPIDQTLLAETVGVPQ